MNNGYGRAGFGIINSLKELGHKVGFDYRKAPVEITFAQPTFFEPNDRQHQIILCPWESTELPAMWLEYFHTADEVWATSDWVADVYRNQGVENVTNVYPHGIEKRFKPRLRRRRGPIRFLNLGGPANRKGSQEALDAFRIAFEDDPRKATLTIKAYQRSNVRWYDTSGRVRAPADLPNVDVNLREYELQDLIKFVDQFDALIYPTYGEGFGYIPLETLAMAMPTVSTAEWAQYRNYIHLPIKTTMIESPWEGEHPGKVFKPDLQSIVEQITNVYENYDDIALVHFRQGLDIHREYNWNILTQTAFDRTIKNFG